MLTHMQRINNILAAKSEKPAQKAEFVSVYTPDNTDTDVTTYATDSYSGVTITNQLQDCKADVTYLTRSDWEELSRHMTERQELRSVPGEMRSMVKMEFPIHM